MIPPQLGRQQAGLAGGSPTYVVILGAALVSGVACAAAPAERRGGE